MSRADSWSDRSCSGFSRSQGRSKSSALTSSSRTARRAAGLGCVLLCIFSQCALALDAAKPPGQNFDFSHWKLTLPVNTTGIASGLAAEVLPPQLTAGFTNSFFYTARDGAMAFWCPVTGATTPRASYPRCELRELVDPANANNANWTAYGTHILQAQCQVLQVPSSGKVVIGQIHSFLGNANPLLKLQYNNRTVEALVKQSSTSDTDTHYTLTKVALGSNIFYQIKVVDGLLSMVVNGSTQSVNFFRTDPQWATNTFYFKAGAYGQDNSGSVKEGSLVAFSSLSRAHPPLISTQPSNETVTAGQPATFSIVANGATPLSYQWYFNTNLLMAGATNAILTVTNPQPAQAGAYYVVVINALGTATSKTAMLIVNPLEPGKIRSVTLSGDSALVVCSGRTGQSYQVRRSTNLVNWLGFVTTNAPGDGLFEVRDEFTDLGAPPATAFYQLLSPGAP